jgi:hypothetical protein
MLLRSSQGKIPGEGSARKWLEFDLRKNDESPGHGGISWSRFSHTDLTVDEHGASAYDSSDNMSISRANLDQMDHRRAENGTSPTAKTAFN